VIAAESHPAFGDVPRPSTSPICKARRQNLIVVTYEIRVFFEGAEKEIFSSIFKKTL
jgi:hypothetical protein